MLARRHSAAPQPNRVDWPRPMSYCACHAIAIFFSEYWSRASGAGSFRLWPVVGWLPAAGTPPIYYLNPAAPPPTYYGSCTSPIPQIVDEESPARSVRTDDLIAVSWRPQEAYSIHTLDATLQRINAIHESGKAKDRPVAFVLMTGDVIDLAQFNELQWFLDTMDGKTVTPDSGALDGPARSDNDALNPKLPYDATGLDPEIPWYTCYGNHDGLATGNFPIDRDLPNPEDWFAPLLPIVADTIGYHRLDPAWDFMLPTADLSPAVVLGSGPPLRPGTRQIDLDALAAGPIEPDPARRFLSKRDFIARHLASTGTPLGHGFTQRSLARGETWYSTRPVPNVPVRLIVFDTVASGPHYGLPLFYGALLREHLEEFILPELEMTEAASEWVILASHHPSADFSLPFPAETVGTEEFRAAVSRFPNVVAHLAGHTHRNRARIVAGTYPYLEIETGAIIDYPQEGRVLDLFIEPDGASIRVESTMFSHAEAPTTFSAESYRRALIDAGLRKRSGTEEAEDPAGTAGDRDASWRLQRK